MRLTYGEITTQYHICKHLYSFDIIVLRYDIKAPSLFKVRQVGKTLVNRWNINLILAHQLKAIRYC